MAVVASGYYVESVSRMTQPAWLDRMEAVLGAAATRGSRAHLALDETQGHIDEAWNMSMRLVKTAEDEVRFVRHVKRLHALLGAYVGEVLRAVLGDEDLSATAADSVRAPAAAWSPS